MNRTKKKIIFIVTLVTGTALISVLAVGCGHGHKNMTPERAKKMASWKIEDALDEVNASDKQIASFETAANTVIDDIFEMKASHKAKHGELARELTRKTPDEQKILALVDEHLEEVRDVAHNSVETMLEAWNTLSVKQKQQLIAQLEAHHREMGQ